MTGLAETRMIEAAGPDKKDSISAQDTPAIPPPTTTYTGTEEVLISETVAAGF